MIRSEGGAGGSNDSDTTESEEVKDSTLVDEEQVKMDGQEEKIPLEEKVSVMYCDNLVANLLGIPVLSK